MNKLFRNPVLGALSSVKLGIVLMAVFAIAIAKATFIESDFGAEGARALVYNARWFEIVMGLFTLNLFLFLLRRIPIKPWQLGSFIVHLSIIVILVSAGVTRYFGYEGVMSIREGSSVDYMISRETYVQLQVSEDTASYPVRIYRGGDLKLGRKLSVDGDEYKVELREFWPHFESRYEASDSGPAALLVSAASGRDRSEIMLLTGENATLADVPLSYVDEPLSTSVGGSPFGDLQVHAGGDRATFPVPSAVPATYEMSGWTFAISEFQTAFRVGAGTSYEGPLTNPMIRVDITSPDGRKGQRILFALHPEFSMSHNGQEEAFSELDILYSYQQGIRFGRDAEGSVIGVTSLALVESRMGAGDDYQEIAAGAPFTVKPGILYQTPDGTFSLVIKEILDHVALTPGPSDNERAPAAGRITVTAADGTTAQAIVIKGNDRWKPVTLGDRQVNLRFGPEVIHLPYSIHLDDFLLLNYPGSRNPASYESHVRLTDAASGIEGKPVRIYMNHPLTHRGFKHFQSSYDPDERGTVLSVNYDPGKWPTYIGYILISLGFALFLARDLIWTPRKRNGGISHEL